MLTAESSVIGLSFSLPAKGPFYDIELVGFRERELTLIRSVFKLSEMRTRHFRVWDPSLAHQPHAVMVELDSGPETVTAALRLAQAVSGALIGVGADAAHSNLPLNKRIDRPVRWANVLAILDELFQDDGQGVSSMGGRDGWAEKTSAAQIAQAENEIERLQLEPRFDPNHVITFHTEPGILVIDPDHTTTNTIRTLLSNDGYRVDSAGTANEAYKLLASHRYNIVFSERAVSGVDALEIARVIKLRDDRRSTAIVILSNHGSLADRLVVEKAGCHAYLRKPLEADKFQELINKFIPNWVMKKR